VSKSASPSEASPSALESAPTRASTEETPASRPRTVSPFHQALKRTWRRLHFRFPKLIPTPYNDERDYLLRRDAEDNVASRVPSDERLRQVALWGIEVFGPAEIDGLYLALEKLGWNEDRLFGLNTAPSSWIREQRTYGTEGNLNLGLIERPGKSRFIPRGRPAPLPEAVDYAHGYVYQLSPSVTAVILCFVLNDSASSAYQVELSIDRRTEHEPLDNGYRSYNVEHVKGRAIDLARSKSRKIVIEWFDTHLPGLFSRAPDGNRLPTAELLTTAQQPLFGEIADAKRREPDWVKLVTPRGHHEVWVLNDFDGLTLCWPEFEGDLRYHGIVNLRTHLLTTEHLEHSGEKYDAACASFVSDRVQGVLVNFAATAVLREIIRGLRLAPGALSADATSRRNTVRCLEQIRLFFDKSIGIPALTSELAARSEKIHSYKWECAHFRTQPWRAEDQPVEISEALRSRTHFLASRAGTFEKETREHLKQLSTILSTTENVRTQARMELVAVGAAILSFVSVLVAIM